MSKILRSKINNLKKMQEKAPSDLTKANKNRIDEIIKLYTDRRISNIATAENLIKGLSSTNKKNMNMTRHFKSTRITSRNSRNPNR